MRAHVISITCIRISKPPAPLARFFSVLRQAVKLNEIGGVDGPIVRQYLDGLEVVSRPIEVKFKLNSRPHALK